MWTGLRYKRLEGHPVHAPKPSYTAFLGPAKRKVYPYSVIPGGVFGRHEVAAAIRRDPVVAAHYVGIRSEELLPVRLRQPRQAYVSYRRGGNVFWTVNRVTIPAGEVVLTDGNQKIRARCGNRLSDAPQQPVAAAAQEPSELVLDKPLKDDDPTPLPQQPEPAELALAQALPAAMATREMPGITEAATTWWPGPSGLAPGGAASPGRSTNTASTPASGGNPPPPPAATDPPPGNPPVDPPSAQDPPPGTPQAGPPSAPPAAPPAEPPGTPIPPRNPSGPRPAGPPPNVPPDGPLIPPVTTPPIPPAPPPDPPLIPQDEPPTPRNPPVLPPDPELPPAPRGGPPPVTPPGGPDPPPDTHLPEPDSVLLLGTGLTLIALKRRADGGNLPPGGR